MDIFWKKELYRNRVPGRIRMVLSALCGLALIAGPVRADTLSQIQKETAAVHSVRAEFTQAKHMRILSRPLISKGVMLFKQPKSIRWEYFSPVKSVLMMDNGKVRRYIEGEEGLVEDQGPSRQIMQFVLQEITHWMKGTYDQSTSFTTRIGTGRRIVLTPKEAAFSQFIQRIELQPAAKPGVMKWVRIIESKDAYTEYTFQNTQVNVPIDDRRFRTVQ